MKRLSVLFLAIIFMIIGCAGFQLSRTEQDIAAKISARHIGAELAEVYPEVAREVSIIAWTALCGNDETLQMEKIRDLLLAEIKDDLLRLDIQDMLNLIDMKIEIPEKQVATIRHVLKGLLQGMGKVHSNSLNEGEAS